MHASRATAPLQSPPTPRASTSSPSARRAEKCALWSTRLGVHRFQARLLLRIHAARQARPHCRLGCLSPPIPPCRSPGRAPLVGCGRAPLHARGRGQLWCSWQAAPRRGTHSLCAASGGGRQQRRRGIACGQRARDTRRGSARCAARRHARRRAPSRAQKRRSRGRRASSAVCSRACRAPRPLCLCVCVSYVNAPGGAPSDPAAKRLIAGTAARGGLQGVHVRTSALCGVGKRVCVGG